MRIRCSSRRMRRIRKHGRNEAEGSSVINLIPRVRVYVDIHLEELGKPHKICAVCMLECCTRAECFMSERIKEHRSFERV